MRPAPLFSVLRTLKVVVLPLFKWRCYSAAVLLQQRLPPFGRFGVLWGGFWWFLARKASKTLATPGSRGLGTRLFSCVRENNVRLAAGDASVREVGH